MADPITLRSDEHVQGRISGFVDADGNPATGDAPPRWHSSDDAIFTVTVSADGMDIDVIASDMALDAPVETATLTLLADEGGVVDVIHMTWDVVVSSLPSPLAVGVAVTFGAPQKKT